jgi:hypothetical protein
MGLKEIILAAAVLGILAATTRQLPRVVKAIRHAEIMLIQESKASTWVKANIPGETH